MLRQVFYWGEKKAVKKKKQQSAWEPGSSFCNSRVASQHDSKKLPHKSHVSTKQYVSVQFGTEHFRAVHLLQLCISIGNRTITWGGQGGLTVPAK